MLQTENTALIMIDVQGKLAQLMHNKETLFRNLQRITLGAQALGIPILWAEQNPDGLGPTIPEVADLLADQKPIAKYAFSCCDDDGFMQALTRTGRKQFLLAGIETHICVYLTGMHLIEAGYEVQVVADAVSSRSPENKQIGLDRIRAAGGAVTCVEMALFELLKECKGETFKTILKVVK
jgi:nicotinamidase-related amidase